jgi:hypothetical protein
MPALSHQPCFFRCLLRWPLRDRLPATGRIHWSIVYKESVNAGNQQRQEWLHRALLDPLKMEHQWPVALF